MEAPGSNMLKPELFVFTVKLAPPDSISTTFHVVTIQAPGPNCDSPTPPVASPVTTGFNHPLVSHHHSHSHITPDCKPSPISGFLCSLLCFPFWDPLHTLPPKSLSLKPSPPKFLLKLPQAPHVYRIELGIQDVNMPSPSPATPQPTLH